MSKSSKFGGKSAKIGSKAGKSSINKNIAKSGMDFTQKKGAKK